MQAPASRLPSTASEGSISFFSTRPLLLLLATPFVLTPETSAYILEADSEYYENSIHWRKLFLGAPDESYLCKTMILENKFWKPNADNDPLYDRYFPRYVCVVYQYITTMNAVKLGKFVREVQNSNMEKKFGNSQFNFRLAENEIQEQMTGYIKNGVTPFNFRQKMPIYLSSRLQALAPQFFWVGGGHPNLKLSNLKLLVCPRCPSSPHRSRSVVAR